MKNSRSFHEEIRRNKITSIMVVFCVALLWLAVGLTIGYAYGNPIYGAIGAGVAAAIQVFIILGGGAKLALAVMGAVKVSHHEEPQLYNVVEEMKIASGLPMPEVYIIRTPALNAFATGLSPNKSAIAVTRGLLDKLNRDELQGVIAHEMSHIRNYDIRVSIVLAVMVGSIVMLCDLFLRSTLYSGRRSRSSSDRDSGGGVIIIIALILAIVAPLIATMLQLLVSRKREYLADASAVELTRNPVGLAGALRKIASPEAPQFKDAGKAFAHFFIAEPVAKKLTKRKSSSVFDTHPPVWERIARLEEMAHLYQKEEE